MRSVICVVLFGPVSSLLFPQCPMRITELSWLRQKAVLPDACKLLTDAEVRSVFPDAKSGERTREECGIAGCAWHDAKGDIVLSIDQYTSEANSVEKDARGFVHAVIDPLKPSAISAVRVEQIKDVGDQAMAVVERADDRQGILWNAAYLVSQRGERMIMLISTELAIRGRPAALKALEELGRAAAKRL